MKTRRLRAEATRRSGIEYGGHEVKSNNSKCSRERRQMEQKCCDLLRTYEEQRTSIVASSLDCFLMEFAVIQTEAPLSNTLFSENQPGNCSMNLTIQAI